MYLFVIVWLKQSPPILPELNLGHTFSTFSTCDFCFRYKCRRCCLKRKREREKHIPVAFLYATDSSLCTSTETTIIWRGGIWKEREISLPSRDKIFSSKFLFATSFLLSNIPEGGGVGGRRPPPSCMSLGWMPLCTLTCLGKQGTQPLVCAMYVAVRTVSQNVSSSSSCF